VKFVVVGTGDMEGFMIEKAAELGIADKVLFAGFMRGKDIDRAYRMADLYVMPSVSEPFGITPLEAMRNGTPVLISKQSGVSEVISHCLKVDFWDIWEMANKIVCTLRYNELHHCMQEHGSLEVRKFNWNVPASKCIEVYNSLLRQPGET
jgi:glycosyltransferase involved in cell wall biosynthesis